MTLWTKLRSWSGGAVPLVVLAGVMAASVGVRAAETPETGVWEIDLASPDAWIEEHTARIAWHLKGDNLVNPSVAAAWYSSYVDTAGTLGGRVVIDLDVGTVTGEVIETWACDGCQGWAYREAGLVATITDGHTRWEDGELLISGEVNIAYRARGGRDEAPSQCGDSECYICENRFCTFNRTGAGTASLEGWLEQDTLSLAFADRLEADVSQMDVSGLADTEYFMSRFSVTVAGVAPAAAGGSEATADAGQPAGESGAGEADAGVPPAPDDSDDDASDEAAADTEEAAGQPPSDAKNDGGLSATGLIIAVVLILAGLMGFVIMLRFFYHLANPAHDVRNALRKAAWQLSDKAAPPPPPETGPHTSIPPYSERPDQSLYTTTVEQVPYTPGPYQIIGAKEFDYEFSLGRIDHTEHGVHKPEYVHLAHGTRVTVLDRTDTDALVQPTDGSSRPMWVDRRDLQAPSPAESPAPPPPLPPPPPP